jgi:hypothetical protein
MEVMDNTYEGIYIYGYSNTLNQVKSDNNGTSGIELGECCSLLTGIQTNSNKGDGLDLDSDDFSVIKATADKTGEREFTAKTATA